MMSGPMEFFVTLNLVFSAGLVAVMLVRAGVRRRFGAPAAYALWALPLALMLAFLVPARTVLVEQPAPTLMEWSSDRAIDAGYAGEVPVTGGIENTETAEHLIVDTRFYTKAVWVLWAVGACGLLAMMIVRQRRFCASLGDLQPGAAVGQPCFHAGAVGVGPALVGFVRPKLVLPADFTARFDADEQDLVIAHEARHKARRDPLVNALAALLTCFFWYNPLTYLAVSLMRRDQEMACDAEVLSRRPHDRARYARALVKAQFNGGMMPLVCAWPSIGGHALKERVSALQSSGLRRRSGVAMTCAVALCGTAVWASQPPSVVYSSADAGLALSAGNLAMTVAAAVEDGDAEEPSYLDMLAAEGIADMDVEEVIAMKVHGVDAALIRTVRDLGFEATPDNLVAAAIADVTPEFMAKVRSAFGPDVKLHNLIAMRHMGVALEDVDAYGKFGLPALDLDTLIQFRAVGVSPAFIEALRAAGVEETEPRAFIAAAAMGVTSDFIAEAAARGFANLTLRQYAQLKSAGVL